jgi:heavy metal sensor kinase
MNPRGAAWQARVARFPQSTRFILTLWYLAILAAILCAFGATLYGGISRRTLRDIDKGLVLSANGVSDAIFAFWKAEASGIGSWLSSPSPTLLGEVERGRFLDLVSRWAERTGQLDTPSAIRLLDRDGRPLGASSSFQRLEMPLDPGAINAARAGHMLFESLELPSGRIRLMTYPVLENGSVLYLIQAAGALDLIFASLERLRVSLLLLIPITLIITSSVGWFLAGIAMRPVGKIIAQAREIGIGQLHERVMVPSTGDELERLAVTFNDLLSRLQQGFRRMRQFSAAASHELRTPLTVMKGELEVTLRKPRDAKEYERVLRTHLDAIDEMSATVQELLTLARSEAVEGAVEWKQVDLSGLAERVSETWHALSEAKSIELRVETVGPVLVSGEPMLLERLLANLIDNALRHTPSGGCITVSAGQQGEQACLRVQDTGPGIADAELPHIFDRFFKPRASTETTSTGLGLGLCRWIAEAHHGRIEVAGPPGKGAVFTVWLPALSAA